MLVLTWQELNFVLTFAPFRIDIARGEAVVASINRSPHHAHIPSSHLLCVSLCVVWASSTLTRTATGCRKTMPACGARRSKHTPTLSPWARRQVLIEAIDSFMFHSVVSWHRRRVHKLAKSLRHSGACHQYIAQADKVCPSLRVFTSIVLS